MSQVKLLTGKLIGFCFLIQTKTTLQYSCRLFDIQYRNWLLSRNVHINSSYLDVSSRRRGKCFFIIIVFCKGFSIKKGVSSFIFSIEENILGIIAANVQQQIFNARVLYIRISKIITLLRQTRNGNQNASTKDPQKICKKFL